MKIVYCCLSHEAINGPLHFMQDRDSLSFSEALLAKRARTVFIRLSYRIKEKENNGENAEVFDVHLLE